MMDPCSVSPPQPQRRMYVFYSKLLLCWVLVTSYATQYANSQSFKSPSSWRKPDITTSSEDRVNIASAALDKITGELSAQAQSEDLPYSTTGRSVYAQMAEFDRLTNQTKYKDQLKDYLGRAQRINAFSDTFYRSRYIVLSAYGYAAAWAYAAYKDDDFLDFAADSWSFGWNYTLKQDEVDGKSTPVKDFNISQTCQGITMAGGTFWSTNRTQASLNGLGTGLSAALAAVTSNQTYLDAAAQSLSFIHAHLYNVDGVVQDTISASEKDSCATSNGVFAYNSGLMIEGLAILAEVTENVSMQELLRDTVAATIQKNKWQGDDGVMNPPDDFLIRGLSAAYSRNTTPSDMRGYLKDYLGFNAILEQASNGANIYGSSWVGPPYSIYSADNQSKALNGLLAAIPLINDAPSTNNTDSFGGDEQSSSNSKKSPIGPIVGSVVGGIVFLSLCLIGAFLFLRQRQNRRQRRKYRSQVSFGPFDSMATHTRTNSESSLVIRQAENENPGMSLLYTQNMSEKARRQLARHLAEQQLRSASLSENDRTSATFSASPAGNAASDPHMSTVDLVRLLNERLQPGQWREELEEVPPEYIEAGSSRG
ncbi:hypothetical protein D9758_015567 [Tetrapyrgos nigripes]|uniref:Glycoside hydrolase family 76 protein n=1 Tax=Tetrapyrgos nigripes TaxID=182062 RepID=A0A8H5CDN1_9AGAR|nr:hypothetical protein D9758_015567 [Tetrapyrgos nigripes]